MKKQLLVIHGGRSYSNYEVFLESLKSKKLDNPLEQKPDGWKKTLHKRLSDEYEVFSPQMPNSQNAKYEEWKIWFERHFEFLHDDLIILGHSLGGYFVAKYFSENIMPVSVKAVYLVAAVYESDNFDGEDGGDFAFNPNNLSNMANNIGKIFILHSKDDPVVPYAHALKFKEALPGAELVSFEDKGHFLLEEFPELIESIQDLC